MDPRPLGARRGHEKLYGTDVTLRPGDALLLAGSWADLDRHTSTPEVLVVDEPAVLLRVVTITQTYRGIGWTTVVLVAGMIPLATAFQVTGAADLIVGGLIGYVGTGGPHLALLLVCLLTLVLGQLISNTATVLVVTPVAVAVATTMSVSVLPFMMALTVVGGAAFLTPVATPANLVVMEPGGYRFTDY